MVRAAALLLAAAQTLVGNWAFVDLHRDASMPVEECATDFGVRYAADGTWTSFTGDERGTWRTARGVVRERVTHRIDEATGRERRVREPASTYRLRWFSPNHVNTIDGKEEVSGLIHCPAVP